MLVAAAVCAVAVGTAVVGRRAPAPNAVAVTADPAGPAPAAAAAARPAVDQQLPVPATDAASPATTGPEPLSTAPPVTPSSQPLGTAPPAAEPDWETLAQSVVELWAPDCGQAGSGTIIGGGRHVLTNSHVLHEDGDGPVCEVYVGFAHRFDVPPGDWQRADLIADDPVRDLAVVSFSGTPERLPAPLRVESDELALGDEITILGYPGFGQSQETLTFTSGTFSGTTTSAEGHRLLKTDALLDSGVSGGAVLDRHGRLIGVATGGFEGDGGTLGIAIPGTEVLRFLIENGVRPEPGSSASSAPAGTASGALPAVTFPEASVRDPRAEAADLERRRSVIGLFERLRVAAEHRSGYDRETLFDGWLYRSGLSTREWVLRDEQRANGTWFSAYDAAVVTDKAELDIDHLVPLAEAWESGGHLWTEATWTRYANDLGDPRSLIAVNASTNRGEGARDPAEWWPSDASYRCQYAVDWIAVKTRWDLAVDLAEHGALESRIEQCEPDQFDFDLPPLAASLSE